MNKTRLEAFSDGVFSIAMTLLVFGIKVPTLPATATNAELWQAILYLTPLFSVYLVSFAVMSVLWINHHFLFHSFAAAVDRKLNLLNLGFLMFVVLIPFSAQLISTYPTYQSAAVIYGVNIFAIVLLSTAMMRYMRFHPELMHQDLSQRLLNQASFRARISILSYILGIGASFFSTSAAIFLYAFPVIFNIIPGTLDLAERIFRFSLD